MNYKALKKIMKDKDESGLSSPVASIHSSDQSNTALSQKEPQMLTFTSEQTRKTRFFYRLERELEKVGIILTSR